MPGPDAPPRVLMVGAGAVGQVFAWFLMRGGASVSFLIKPTHALPAELPMLEQVRTPTVLHGFGRLTTNDEVAKQEWDQVWLAVPSNALAEPWLPALLRVTGTATVVTLAAEGVTPIAPSRRVVGSIPFIAWQDPLPGHSGPERLAFWVPPLAPVTLSGDDSARLASVQQALSAGGLRSARVADSVKAGMPLTALLMASVASLEAAGWRLAEFRGRWSTLAGLAAREVMTGEGVGAMWRLLARGPVLRLVFWFASKVLPFDLEAYMKYHFTKVGEQTRVFMALWVQRGRARGLPVDGVEQLLTAIGPHRR